MIIPKPFYLTLGLALLPLAGCSTMQSARDTASVLALYTAQVKADSEKFSAARLELDKARTENIDFLEQSAVELENGNALGLKVWHLSNNDDRAKLCEGLTASSDLASKQADEFAALRAKQAEAVANMKSVIIVQSKQLEETAKGLSALAEKPSWQDEAKFYFGFLSEVRTDIDNLSTNAAQKVASGTNAIAEKASTTKTSITPPKNNNP
jgi:hypothetical protein